MKVERKHRRRAAIRWNETAPPLALYAAARPIHAMLKMRNLEFQGNWRPAHVEQSRDCGQNECDASSENSH